MKKPNQEVRNKIQDTIGKNDGLLSIVKKCKLRWNSHISRVSAMTRTVLQGTVNGTRWRGRHRKRSRTGQD